VSHFGNDADFKRIFSGFGYEGHHHGHGEAKFRVASHHNQVDLNAITYDNSLFKVKKSSRATLEIQKAGMPSIADLNDIL
jgi:hypothetical protein